MIPFHKPTLVELLQHLLHRAQTEEVASWEWNAYNTTPSRVSLGTDRQIEGGPLDDSENEELRITFLPKVKTKKRKGGKHG